MPSGIYCKELYEALETHKPILFDCVGGCGIDTSVGNNPCMGAVGIWFKFCPFCGRKIESNYKKGYWEWYEIPPKGDAGITSTII